MSQSQKPHQRRHLARYLLLPMAFGLFGLVAYKRTARVDDKTAKSAEFVTRQQKKLLHAAERAQTKAARSQRAEQRQRARVVKQDCTKELTALAAWFMAHKYRLDVLDCQELPPIEMLAPKASFFSAGHADYIRDAETVECNYRAYFQPRCHLPRSIHDPLECPPEYELSKGEQRLEQRRAWLSERLTQLGPAGVFAWRSGAEKLAFQIEIDWLARLPGADVAGAEPSLTCLYQKAEVERDEHG